MEAVFIWVYLETINQVISVEQFKEDNFQSMVSAGIIQCKHIKRPHIYMLQTHRNQFYYHLNNINECVLVYLVLPKSYTKWQFLFLHISMVDRKLFPGLNLLTLYCITCSWHFNTEIKTECRLTYMSLILFLKKSPSTCAFIP